MTATARNRITKRRLRVGWKFRHLAVIALSAFGTLAFAWSRQEWSEMHQWNRAFGDMSLVLVALTMAIGPLSRIWRPFAFAIPWRREGGIYGVLLGFIHTAIVLVGWVEFDFLRLFGFENVPAAGSYVMVQHGFALANAIGVVALLYGLMLALSSNDWSQRVLGGPIWKFLQQSSYVLWVLIVVHTAYFLYVHFLDFHRRVPEPNWAQWPFVILVLAVLLLQWIAFRRTWKQRASNREEATA